MYANTNQNAVEHAKRAGQAVLNFRKYEAETFDKNQAGVENETNQKFVDQGKVLWNTGVNTVEGTINTGIDLIRLNNGRNPLALVDPFRPRVDFSGIKADYRSEMMRTDVNGKLDGNGLKRGDFTEGAVTILAPLVVGRVATPTRLQSLNLPKPLTAIELQSEVQAANLINNAVKSEPEITATLSKTAKETGGKLVGLENRVKSQESLSRKIADKVQQKVDKLQNVKGKSIDEATKFGLEKELPKQTGKINDVLRYTKTFTENEYQAGIQKTLSALEKQGYKVEKVYDGWSLRKAGLDKDTGYRGINVTMKNPKGQQFELQFHTKSSFDLKTKNHLLYEEWRNPKTTDVRKKEIIKIQIKKAENLSLPKDIDNIPKMIEEFVKRGNKLK
jgi:hypothetical protein